MHPSTASVQLAQRAVPRRDTEPRLHGHWLLLARIACLTLCVLSVGIYVLGVLTFISQHFNTCTGAVDACHAPGPVVVRTIRAPGFPPDAVSVSIIVRDTIWSLGYWLVATFLLWRKSDDRLALLAAAALGAFPVVFNIAFTTTLSGLWWLLAAVISFIGSLTFGLFYYVFPSGRFVPRWVRWFFGVQLVYWLFNAFFPFAAFNPFHRSHLLNDAVFIWLIVSMVAVQIYRYRQVSTSIQRQQTKWIVYGFSVGWGAYLANLFLSFPFPVLQQIGPPIASINGLVVYACMFLIPLSIGFAIVRARLWDIDVVINRTLVYGILTVCVVCLYVLVGG